MLQSYENALEPEDLDEEAKTKLYKTLLAYMKDNEDGLDLPPLGEDEEEAKQQPTPESEPREICAVPPTLQQDDVTPGDNDDTDRQAGIARKEEATPPPPAGSEVALKPAAAAADDLIVELRVKDEEDTDLETKKLLEEAAAENFAKR